MLLLSPNMEDVSLRHVFHDGDKKVAHAILQKDRQQISELLQSSVDHAFSSLKEPPVDTSWAASAGTAMGDAVAPDDLSKLQASYPSDYYLRLRVTDFGETPRRWRTAYITFEVVTTLAIAGAFYVHKVTRPVAGVYLLQESIEELSEGYAGFWALNRLSQPVRIEGDLIDGHTGNVLLHVKHTGMSSWSWGHIWHMDTATREALEHQSMQRAVNEVLKDLAAYFGKDCHPRRLADQSAISRSVADASPVARWNFRLKTQKE